MANNKNAEGEIVKMPKEKSKKESFAAGLKRWGENVSTDIQLKAASTGEFFKRNGKKIATGVGVITAAVVTTVVMDKMNIDPTNLFRRRNPDEDCPTGDETFATSDDSESQQASEE